MAKPIKARQIRRVSIPFLRRDLRKGDIIDYTDHNEFGSRFIELVISADKKDVRTIRPEIGCHRFTGYRMVRDKRIYFLEEYLVQRTNVDFTKTKNYEEYQRQLNEAGLIR